MTQNCSDLVQQVIHLRFCIHLATLNRYVGEIRLANILQMSYSGESEETNPQNRLVMRRALAQRCVDRANFKTCQKAAKNQLCTKGRMGGFGSSIRARCAATCKMC